MCDKPFIDGLYIFLMINNGKVYDAINTADNVMYSSATCQLGASLTSCFSWIHLCFSFEMRQ